MEKDLPLVKHYNQWQDFVWVMLENIQFLLATTKIKNSYCSLGSTFVQI